MHPRSHWFSFILLSALAAALAIGGARLARRSESVKVERDGAPLRAFEERIQAELARLEQLYERHLATVANTTAIANSRDILQASNWLVGIKQFSLIQDSTPVEPSKDQHVAVEKRINEILPEPTLVRRNEVGLSRRSILLSPAEILEGESDHGWFTPATGEMLYWQKRDRNHAVVLLLDSNAIRTAINRHLREWAKTEFEILKNAGGSDALLAPDRQPLVSAGTAEGAPNTLLLLRTRFGSWRLASWDQYVLREQYHLPTLLTGLCGAVVVMGLAVMVFVQQRSALRLAAQRVSFVNSVSHELRTPLTNMLLNLDIVSDEVSENSQRRLTLVREEAGRLGRLIENVLTFSRSEQGKLALRAHACKPTDLIDAVLAQFAPGFERRNIVARHEGSAGACVVAADALSQIVANLLSNVEKYAPGSEVVVSSRWSHGQLFVRVADTGPGIPAHAAERVFRAFERLDSRISEGVSGTGLGLAIARDLAAQMGGTLHLLPTERGATFELSVPASAVPALKATNAA